MTYYGMFSDEGNLAVAKIVEFAKANSECSWSDVYAMLSNLAKVDRTKFGEATDTMVREMVYDELGFTSDFYV